MHDVINNGPGRRGAIAGLRRVRTLPSRSFSTKSEQALSDKKEKAYEMRGLTCAHRHQENATGTSCSLAIQQVIHKLPTIEATLRRRVSTRVLTHQSAPSHRCFLSKSQAHHPSIGMFGRSRSRGVSRRVGGRFRVILMLPAYGNYSGGQRQADQRGFHNI